MRHPAQALHRQIGSPRSSPGSICCRHTLRVGQTCARVYSALSLLPPVSGRRRTTYPMVDLQFDRFLRHDVETSTEESCVMLTIRPAGRSQADKAKERQHLPTPRSRPWKKSLPPVPPRVLIRCACKRRQEMVATTHRRPAASCSAGLLDHRGICAWSRDSPPSRCPAHRRLLKCTAQSSTAACALPE